MLRHPREIVILLIIGSETLSVDVFHILFVKLQLVRIAFSTLIKE